MHSRLFVRIGSSILGPRRIRAGEQPVPAGFCQHRFAGADERGRNCPQCGLPMLSVPPAAR